MSTIPFFQVSDIKASSYIGLSTQLQDVNITMLRQYFKNLKSIDGVDREYDPYLPYTHITITGEFPRRQVSLPAIVVSMIGTSNIMNKMIGREFYRPLYTIADGVKKRNGYQISGIFTSDFSISVASESTVERRDLLDMLIMLYRTAGSEYLKKFGITVTDIKMGSPKTELLVNDFIYFDSINITAHTEWKQLIQNIPLITQIEIDEVEVESEVIL